VALSISPQSKAHVHLKDLALDKERAGDFYIDAVTHGRQLDLNAHSDFEKADLTILGSVALEHDFPADLNLSFHHLDADSLLRTTCQERSPDTLFWMGRSTFEVPCAPARFKSRRRDPVLQRRGRARVDTKCRSIRIELADQFVLVENFHLAGSGTDFTAHGRVHLTGAREVDLRLDGSVNMTLLQSSIPRSWLAARWA